MKVIKFKGVEPVRNKDGTWDLIKFEETREYADDAVRHNDLCTACGFPAYPECLNHCTNGRIEEKIG